MASIIPEYNYDIFISYRQKDNKGDKWVSEFVDALKDELESTFKEEISVYFDINPHDGLLETHDVDESLKEKLKCLVFIPIISRTYCDPKSFAWEHEFKVFVEQAGEDQFGLKVKLPGGNVASRVLPVQIHDLDKADIKLCESVIGGVLRGIEFIHKASGVNRPLTSKDDLIIESGKVFYKDQLNKVANAIQEVLSSLTTKELSGDEAITEEAADKSISTKRSIRKKTPKIPSISFLYKLKNLTTLSPKAWRIIALVFIAASMVTFWFARETAPLPPKLVLKYDIPISGNLSYPGRKSIAISRNGEFLVYASGYELNLKLLNSDLPSFPIPGTEYARYPAISPDGKWIVFESVQDRKIVKVQLPGGNPIPICDMDGSIGGINWYENEIIFVARGAIYRVPDSGGSPELIYPLNESENDPKIWNPQLLPDSKTLLFSQLQEDGNWDIRTWRLGSKKKPVVLVNRGIDGRYLNSGHIVYSVDNRLYVRKFDPKKNRFIPEPQIINTKPVFEIGYGSAQFDFSDNGCLVYYEEPPEFTGKHLVWIDTTGEYSTITRDLNDFYNATVSYDGQNIATQVRSDLTTYQMTNVRSSSVTYEIDIINTKLGTSSLFVENALYPVWSKDNSSIIYVTGNQVYKKPLDRSKSPMLLFELDSATSIQVGNISRDGRYLPLSASIPGKGSDIGYFDMSNKKVEMLEYYNTESSEGYSAISPDGNWIVYRSTYGGNAGIYVAPFPGPGKPEKVSLDRESGTVNYPIWAPDMTALYYMTNDPDYELWKVKFQASEEFIPEEPQSIFNGGDNLLNYGFTIHPDGDRFLAVQRAGDENQEPVVKVIVNWEQELTDK